jgi:hypothetical protein
LVRGKLQSSDRWELELLLLLLEQMGFTLYPVDHQVHGSVCESVWLELPYGVAYHPPHLPLLSVLGLLGLARLLPFSASKFVWGTD